MDGCWRERVMKYKFKIRKNTLEFLKSIDPNYQADLIFMLETISHKGLTSLNPFNMNIQKDGWFTLTVDMSCQRLTAEGGLSVMGKYGGIKSFNNEFLIYSARMTDLSANNGRKIWTASSLEDSRETMDFELGELCPLLDNREVRTLYETRQIKLPRRNIPLSRFEKIKKRYFTSLEQVENYHRLQRDLHFKPLFPDETLGGTVNVFNYDTGYKVKPEYVSLPKLFGKLVREKHSITIVNFLDKTCMSGVAQSSFANLMAYEMSRMATKNMVNVVNVTLRNSHWEKPYLKDFSGYFAGNRLMPDGAKRETNRRPFSMVLGYPIYGNDDYRLYDFDLFHACLEKGITHEEQNKQFLKNRDQAIHELLSITGRLSENIYIPRTDLVDEQVNNPEVQMDYYKSDHLIIVKVNDKKLYPVALDCCARATAFGCAFVEVAIGNSEPKDEIEVIKGDRSTVIFDCRDNDSTRNAVLENIAQGYETHILPKFDLNPKRIKTHMLPYSNLVDLDFKIIKFR